MSLSALDQFCIDQGIDLSTLIALMREEGYKVTPPVDLNKATNFLCLRRTDTKELERVWPRTKSGTATRIANAMENLGLTCLWELAERGVDNVKMANFGRTTKEAFKKACRDRGIVPGTPGFDLLIENARRIHTARNEL